MTIATSPAALIETHFGGIKDPRAAHSIEHKLIDILIITILVKRSGVQKKLEILREPDSHGQCLVSFTASGTWTTKSQREI